MKTDLFTHAAAARAIAEAFADEFAAQNDEQLAIMAGMLSAGFNAGADRMERAAREGIGPLLRGCALMHGTMTTATCPACGAAKL
jgi:hypothetical protein